MGLLNKETGILILFLVLVTLSAVTGAYLLLHMPFSRTTELTGAVTTKLFVVSTFTRQCNTTLIEDFNLVSFHCSPANKSPPSFFSDLMENLTSVHAYNPLQEDKWSAYNPSLPSWVVQDLEQVVPEKGYWVRVSANSSISINGSYQLPVSVPLYAGWNLAGYPLAISKPIEEALGALSSLTTLIRMYNASDRTDPWKVYNPQLPAFNDLHNFTPLYGYWINMSQNATWTLNE